MVMADPDIFEMEEYEGIGIFTPGEMFERELDGKGLLKSLGLTVASFGVTLGLTLVLMIPMLLLNLIYIDAFGNLTYAPWTFILLTATEFGFIVPPIWYVRSKGFPLQSLGIRINEPLKEILLGLLFGVVMVAANLAITWFIVEYGNIPFDDSQDSLLLASDWFEVVGWIIVMFVAVGFSEELLFRGYLQKRMEIYLRTRNQYYRLLALVITSFIFAAFHLDLIGLPARFVLGMFLGYLCQKRKYSILGPSVAHGFNNSVVIVLAFLGV